MIAHNEDTILIFTNETFITFKLLKAALALRKSKVTLLKVERLYQHCFELLFTPCLLSVALVLNLVNTKLGSPAFRGLSNTPELGEEALSRSCKRILGTNTVPGLTLRTLTCLRLIIIIFNQQQSTLTLYCA